MTAAGAVGPIGRTDIQKLRIRVHCRHPFVSVSASMQRFRPFLASPAYCSWIGPQRSVSQNGIESLRSLPSSSTLSRRIVAMGRGVEIVRFVTPTIFVLTFAALLWALFL